MVSTSIDSLAMETSSSFLRDIAEFDTKGAISVKICFEDDFDEKAIKTEIETEDNQKDRPKIDNSAFIPILEPKKEPQDFCTLTEQVANTNIVQNNSKNAVVQPVKRKPDELVDKSCASSPKKAKHLQNTINKEESLQISRSNEKGVPLNSTAPRRNENVVMKSAVGLASDTNAPEKSNCSVTVNGLPHNEMDKINVCITKCLATISDHMRYIMAAFDFHKKHKTPKETFKEIKLKYFRSVLKYIYTILLPEEKNYEFIQAFLNNTVQRAHQAAGANHVHTFQDYSNLLYEMLRWGRNQIKHQISQAGQYRNENSLKSTAPENNTLIGQKYSVEETQHGNSKASCSNANANADKICIFSSGPPGRKFSINIVRGKFLQLTGQDLNAEAKTLQKPCSTNDPQTVESDSIQLKATIESKKEYAAKSHSLNTITQQTAIRNEVLQTSNLAETPYQQHPDQSIPSTNLMRKPPPDYSITIQQMNDRAPLLQMQLDAPQMPPSVIYQQIQPQQQNTQASPSPYGILPHLQAQYDQARHTKMQRGQYLPTPPQYVQGQVHSRHAQVIPSQCDSSRQLIAQLGQSPQPQPQYNRAQLLQKQNASIQYQSGHSFSQQGQQMHHDLSGHSQVQQQYRHTRDPQISQQQRPLEKLSAMPVLYVRDSTLSSTHAATNKLSQGVPSDYVQQQSEQLNNANHQKFSSTQYLYQTQDKALSGQWHSQNLNAQQSHPRPATGSQWHQDLNAIYQGGGSTQTQKGSLRTASTDSGFISPLNFNMTTDQPIPSPPQEPDSSLPLITYVTSLSEKAAFIEYGQCIVCKKSTKQMCMGCMKIYYCTYQCQAQDWATHASFCTQQTTSYRCAQPS